MRLLIAVIVLATVLCTGMTTGAGAQAQTSALFEASLNLNANLPTVSLTVNGAGPFTFGLDSGAAGPARISKALATTLHLPIVGKVESRGIGARTIVEPLVKFSAKLNGLALSATQAAVFDDSILKYGVDGIVGLSAFKGYLVTLDYPNDKLLISRGRIDPGSAHSVPFKSPEGIPEIEVSFADRTMRLNIDSGSQGSIGMDVSHESDFTYKTPLKKIGQACGTGGCRDLFGAQLNGAMHVGDITIQDPRVTFLPLPGNGTLGYGFLKEYAITFDQQTSQVQISPETPAAEVSHGANQSEYTGRYGTRTVSAAGANLFLQRDGGPKLPLIRVSENEYAIADIPNAKLQFIRKDGRIVALRVLNPQGQWEASEKDI